jgi:hypothetical protein
MKDEVGSGGGQDMLRGAWCGQAAHCKEIGGGLRLSPLDQCQLARSNLLWEISTMSALKIIEQIKALPPAERAQVTKFVVETDDSWIPDEFKEAMKDAGEGRFDEGVKPSSH